MIILYRSSFTPSDPARAAEIIQAARRNAALGVFGRIVDVPTPDGRRPTFAELFAATHASGPDDISVVANADIFFDRTIRRAEAYPAGRWCMALSRWEWTGKAMSGRPWRGQDAWIFCGPAAGIQGADFPIGVPLCDNRIAHVIQSAGYRVFNPCYSIHAIHLHRSGVRSYTADTPAVSGPYLWVPSGDLSGRIDKTPDEYVAFAASLQPPCDASATPPHC
jgi:hypothetical protein